MENPHIRKILCLDAGQGLLACRPDCEIHLCSQEFSLLDQRNAEIHFQAAASRKKKCMG